jgi:hypothetical protein
MKIDYTLPGLVPSPAPPPAVSEANANGLGFRVRLAMLRPQARVDWRELLRLDRAPAAANLMGPPPRPAGVEAQAGPALRARWQRMLDRHSSLLGEAGGGENTGRVRQMVALLWNLRDLEQAAVARHLSSAQE